MASRRDRGDDDRPPPREHHARDRGRDRERRQSTLLGGGGVDGAIHAPAARPSSRSAAGSAGCPTGEARITGGGRLPAPSVIHTVGPVYRDGGHGEAALLAAPIAAVSSWPGSTGCAGGVPVDLDRGLPLSHHRGRPDRARDVSAICRAHPGDSTWSGSSSSPRPISGSTKTPWPAR